MTKLPKLQRKDSAFCFMESPAGILKLCEDEQGITEISFARAKGEDCMENSRFLDEAKKQLNAYFEGKRKEFDLPLSLHGSDFQMRVWKALCTIPYGETRSYSEIASMLNNPKAQRAVGMANHANPVVIVIPCHRVIQKNGAAGGYAGGVKTKEMLLELESRNRI